MSARKRTPITIKNHQKASIDGAAQEQVMRDHKVQEYRIPYTSYANLLRTGRDQYSG